MDREREKAVNAGYCIDVALHASVAWKNRHKNGVPTPSSNVRKKALQIMPSIYQGDGPSLAHLVFVILDACKICHDFYRDTGTNDKHATWFALLRSEADRRHGLFGWVWVRFRHAVRSTRDN